VNREEARQYIIQRGKEHLAPDRSKKGFICPICGSGSGNKGTGITTKDGVHFTCWTGCFTNADIIDIIGLENGLTDYNDKLQAAAREYNITIESYHRSTAQEDFAEAERQERREYQSKPKVNDLHKTIYTIQHTQASKRKRSQTIRTSFYRRLRISERRTTIEG